MAVQKKSLENLKPINENVTPEQRKANGRKGGIKSGESRRKKKEMKQLVSEILEMSLYAGKVENFNNLADSSGKNMSVEQALILAQVKQAMRGNTKALEFLRDTMGEKPVDKQEVKTSVEGTGKLDDIFKELNRKD